MHADETNQAVKTGELLETGRHRFDPGDHHGPTLYYVTPPLAWLRCQHTLAELDESSVRLVPARFGTAAFLRPADSRNPYAYVHSSPDVLKYRSLVGMAQQKSPDRPVLVIGEEYWPLPWYLRELTRLGYWSTPPAECDGALVLSTGGQSSAVRIRLHGRYTETFLGLRLGVICTVFTREL